MLEKNTVIYCDMDGVIADFNGAPDALTRFKTEKGFFANLEAISENLEALKVLMYRYRVVILSTSPNNQADRDKFTWLMKHLPSLTLGQVIFTRPEKDKADYVAVSPNTLLIDDYTANLKAWADKGGKTLKLVNKYDSIQGKHIELGIEFVTSLRQILSKA